VKSKLLKTDNNDDDTKDNENTLIWTNWTDTLAPKIYL
jgi:hypothetical protein